MGHLVWHISNKPPVSSKVEGKDKHLSCLLTSIHVPWHAYSHMHTYTHSTHSCVHMFMHTHRLIISIKIKNVIYVHIHKNPTTYWTWRQVKWLKLHYNYKQEQSRGVFWVKGGWGEGFLMKVATFHKSSCLWAVLFTMCIYCPQRRFHLSQ